MEKSIRCDCIGGEHYLHFTYDKEYDHLYVELKAKAHPWGKWFWETIWALIKGKDICQDAVLLEKEKQQEIIQFLIEAKTGLLQDRVDVELPSDKD